MLATRALAHINDPGPLGMHESRTISLPVNGSRSQDLAHQPPFFRVHTDLLVWLLRRHGGAFGDVVGVSSGSWQRHLSFSLFTVGKSDIIRETRFLLNRSRWTGSLGAARFDQERRMQMTVIMISTHSDVLSE